MVQETATGPPGFSLNLRTLRSPAVLQQPIEGIVSECLPMVRPWVLGRLEKGLRLGRALESGRNTKPLVYHRTPGHSSHYSCCPDMGVSVP